MISAGNDVVALAGTDPERTIRPAFYKKILSANEIEQYEQVYHMLMPLYIYVWMLWSVKESAYKYLGRHNTDLVFSPTKFIVSHVGLASFTTDLAVVFKDAKTYTSQVCYASHQLQAKTVVNEDVIHSVVAEGNGLAKMHWTVQKVADASPANLSASVRSLVIEDMQLLLGNKELAILKNEREIPYITSAGKTINIPLSLSHHGNYVAYAFYYDAGAL